MAEVNFYEEIDDKMLKFAVIISRTNQEINRELLQPFSLLRIYRKIQAMHQYPKRMSKDFLCSAEIVLQLVHIGSHSVAGFW